MSISQLKYDDVSKCAFGYCFCIFLFIEPCYRVFDEILILPSRLNL